MANGNALVVAHILLFYALLLMPYTVYPSPFSSPLFLTHCYPIRYETCQVCQYARMCVPQNNRVGPVLN